MQLFGFEIKRSNEEQENNNQPTFIPSTNNDEDGAIEIAMGGAYGSYIDLEGVSKNDIDQITKYREMSTQQECDAAIQDIVNESIVIDEQHGIVDIVLDQVEDVPDTVKKKIKAEFDQILGMLDFNNKGYDIFKKWYVDGRLFYHIIIDTENPKAGIKDLRYIDPRRIRKIREPIKEKDPRTGVIVYKGVNEYFLYNQSNSLKNPDNSAAGVKIAVDSVCYVHSGVMDARMNRVYSHLHKAIKPLNQLRTLEDAVVIYRIARAPERRVWYIDVGSLPKGKAEQALRDFMVRHKNKVHYDASTGEVRDERRVQTFLDDYWLPRREGGRGTEVTTLPSGQNLGEMDDVDYFRRKLYQSLNVPISRLDSESQFNIGRSSEISRDEIKFSRFVDRLRNRFTHLFDDLLEIQLSLKGIATRKEWNKIKQEVYFDFNEDNHFQEMKETEIMRERLAVLMDADQFVGKYFSEDWIKKNVLRLTEDDIKDQDEEIEKEVQGGMVPDRNQELDNGRPAEMPEPNQPPPGPSGPPPRNEEFEKELEQEQKALIASMTKFMDSMVDDEV